MKRIFACCATAAAALTCCATLLFTGCAGKSVASAEKAPSPPNVGVVSVVQKDVPIYGEWVATLQGNVNANIQPQVTGYLIKQNYQEGSFVHKDDVLFEIDPRPLQAVLDQAQAQLAQARGQLTQAQAQLGLAEINVQRDTPLAAARAIAQSQLDSETQARAQAEALVKTGDAAIQAAEATVEQAKLNLGFTKVRSLIDGIAGIAAMQIGNLVYPTSVLTTVSQVDPIKVYFPISEQEYLSLESRMQPGADAKFLPSCCMQRAEQVLPGCCTQTAKQAPGVPLQLTLSNGNIYPHPGRISFADREVNPQTGTIRIVGIFPNPGNVLRPGQFGRIRAETAMRKAALLVPQRAVMELQGRYQVAVVGPDNKVAISTVQIGERVDANWIVNSGLSPGDRVISEGTAKVQDGAVVSPKLESPGDGGR